MTENQEELEPADFIEEMLCRLGLDLTDLPDTWLEEDPAGDWFVIRCVRFHCKNLPDLME